MIDVIVVGAGPAGSIAALVLARAGARVCLCERETLPRPKLCGDTVNPGAVATLAALGLEGGPLSAAVRLRGMQVTSPRSAVRGEYPAGEVALALPRAQFDHWLTEAAVAAGAKLECGVRVRGPLWRIDGVSSGVAGVAGVELTRGGNIVRLPAMITIAADGRRSVLAQATGLSRHPQQPRRWAFGLYATDVGGMTDMGEMHLRVGHYVGFAPLGGGLTNVCVVTGRRPEGRSPEDVIRRVLAADRGLHERTSTMRLAGSPKVLGPLAVDCEGVGIPGLLLAGDAAGFVDPMTGDGVHLAIRGGVLAAEAALRALESGDTHAAVSGLASRREAVLGSKLRFNRWLRRLAGSPMALEFAGVGARVAPGVVKRIVRYAGDAA